MYFFLFLFLSVSKWRVDDSVMRAPDSLADDLGLVLSYHMVVPDNL